MGFLSELFKEQDNLSEVNNMNETLPSMRRKELSTECMYLSVHNDIKELLWIADGQYKNYYPSTNQKYTMSFNSINVSITFNSMDEPSLISMNYPIANVHENVERPSYYPTYRELTPEQRGVYWKLLNNPYNDSIDIGYVFILYYGLERYLMTEKYSDAIDVILKLRDVHSNKSFKSYSANAIILTCLQRQRADIVHKFMKSLDKDYEYSFSSDLFLLCSYCLNLSITARDVIRMSKDVGFVKNNYIKKYPDLFLKVLKENINNMFGDEDIKCDKLLTKEEFNSLELTEVVIYANVSIEDKIIKVPSILSCNEFRNRVYELLNTVHEYIKKQLAIMRKNGKTVIELCTEDQKRKKREVVDTFDIMREKELIEKYRQLPDSSLDRHFVSIDLQNLYYKYRSLDKSYIDKCVMYCESDILCLNMLKDRNGEPFKANIPAFKRLAIIYEKEKDYDNAIEVCNKAIEYYTSVNIRSEASEFIKRRERIISKGKSN